MTDSGQPGAGTASFPRAVSIAVSICVIAGLGVGLLTLAGPLAIWTGLGDFRLAFSLLQIAVPWAGWIALLCLLAAAVAFVLGRQRENAGVRLPALALLAALCAGLAWYVPQTFRPPEGTPAIHDIATDPDNPLEFVAIAPLRADAPNNLDYGVMPGVESVQEHIDIQREAYPDIVPQPFPQSADAVFEAALRAVNSLGWEVVASDPRTRRIEATDTTFWFRFKDDVVIEVNETPAGGAVVQARSVSRVGRGDVGKNAARLREFFARLEASLP
jgi:uncharacterized protein (DUF1499 family)